MTAATPATRTRADTHGSSFLNRLELTARFGASSTVIVLVDASRRFELEDRRLTPDAPRLAESVAHLAHRRVDPGGVDDQRHQVDAFAERCLLEPRERLLDGGRVPAGAQRPHALDLLALERGIDPQELDRSFLVELVAVDADDDALLRLHLGLVAERGVGDLALEEVLLDRRDDAAELPDPLEVVVGLGL